MKTKIITLFTIILSVIAVNAQSEAVKVPAEVQPFVEKDSKTIALESADLNGDGIKDYVLVIERENQTEKDEYGYSANQRPLLILTRGKDNKLSEAKRNENAVMCSSCGGIMGDPFAGVKVGEKTFTVNHYGGSSWRWSEDYTFNYSRIDKTWQLVKIEKNSFQATDEKNTMKRTVLTPPKDYAKVDIADFNPSDYREGEEGDQSAGADKPAQDSKMLDVSDFNQKISKAAAANESWVKFPTQVLAQWLPQFEEFGSRSIEMKSELADITDYLKIVVTDDKYADDSVRGGRYWVEMRKDEQGVWKIVSAKTAWVCRQNRGHQDYSTARCS